MKRKALFVGVNNYKDKAFKDLRYSLSDAVALSGTFAARGFDVEILSNPTTEAVLNAAERKSSDLCAGDVFLFFFAGHGFTAPDGSHLLICSNDSLSFLRHNRAGIPVDLLEEITNGRGFNRAFLLDACRTDVFAGAENRGAETRDLARVSLPDATVHAGTCCVLRSCDRFCPAMEFDDLGHGVFTQALMDVLSDNSFRSTPFGEAFVAGIRSGMHLILSAHSVVGVQNPCFQTNGEAFFLFDDMASRREPKTPFVGASAPVLVKCPVCGRWRNKTETFDCHECGRENLCIDHQDRKTFLCEECSTKRRVLEAEAAHRVEAERLVAKSKPFYDKGEDFYYGRNGCRREYAEAVKWYRKAAEQGHAQAQCDLGWMYDNGHGVPKDCTEAMKWFRKAAEQGHAVAQCSLGNMYTDGRGVFVLKDYAEAVKWYRKAADQGYAIAQFNLGVMYANGRGVPKDYAEAAKWYRKAAEQGNAWAQYNLGCMYLNGRGVPQDNAEAVKWYRKAAEQGDASAQFNLGWMCANGRGVPQDDAESMKWYRNAAEQGHASAQYNLGCMYLNGCGVPQDDAEAVKWYRKAAEQGHENAKNALKRLWGKGQ